MSLPTPSEPPAVPADLLRLRAELDSIDDALHDLLLRRAEIVSDVVRVGAKGPVALRPGREAAILRRLLGRHAGPLAAGAIVRVWREILSGMTSMQGPYALSVCDTDPASGLTALAREHFGALIPLRAYRTAAQAIGEVSAGLATAAVLPMPADDELPAAAWWTALLQRDDPRIHVAASLRTHGAAPLRVPVAAPLRTHVPARLRIHVVARLPFWAPRPEGAPKLQALVVGTVPPDPSGDDRTLLGLEVAPDQSRARLAQAFAAAGLEAAHFILRRDQGAGRALLMVDVAGFVREGDARLATLATQSGGWPPVVLGAYAIPLGGELPR